MSRERGEALKPIADAVYTSLMSNRSRVAITLATALALGAAAYGHAFDLSLPGVLQDIWDNSSWMIYGLAVLGVFVVYRWWALVPAIAPIAVVFYLHNMTDYVAPWREESIGSPDQPVLYAVLLLIGIALHAAPLSIGLLLRAGWEWIYSRHRGAPLSDSA